MSSAEGFSRERTQAVELVALGSNLPLLLACRVTRGRWHPFFEAHFSLSKDCVTLWKWGWHRVSGAFEDRIRIQRVSVGGTLLSHLPTPCCTDRKLETWGRGGLAPCRSWAPGRQCNTVARAGISFPAGPLPGLAVRAFLRQITAPSLSLFPHKLCWHRQVLN